MSFKTDILQIIKDESRVVFDKQIEGRFLSDTLGRLVGKADALVFAASTEEVSALLKYADANKISVTPRGAGTNLVGSTVPQNGGIIIDFSKMNKILEFDADTFTATVESGILLKDFQAFVESKGFFYPPDPGEKSASIGGNIATNAGGMRAVKYGVTRDYVRGLEVVLADGSVTWVGSKNVKDASGLSLKNLIIGSEGTLAVITKCILKIIPKPEYSKSVLVPFADLESGISTVQKILFANANPTAVEFVERKVVELGEKFTGIKYPHPEAAAYLLLTFDGKQNEVKENLEIIKNVVLQNGALDFVIPESPERLEEIWKVRGCLVKAVEATSEQEPVDLVVPIDKVAEFIEFVNKTQKKVGMQMVAFGHAGDGNVHLCVVRGSRSEEEWKTELQKNMECVYSKAYELGGLTSGEHGIGLSKRHYFLKETKNTNLQMMNAIKTSLDPHHILNNKISYVL
ncbi:FAD-binding oxidoreductase [Treponema peruense]|uniref:FAD-binding protein n=1 Tax=Treponema peruense TaxID=2787628 RepID=A0A7T3RDQ1_9SPIR|nr:FAD-binding oxidoreductase [Treponema peruense]QQA01249.1 FAD-binding protein [Treponema peruense]